MRKRIEDRHHIRKSGTVRKWMCAAAAVLGALIMTVGAAASGADLDSADSDSAGNWPVEIDKDSSITLTLKYKNKSDNKEYDMENGKLSLYKVASVKEKNGYVFDVTAGQFADVTGVSDIPSMDTATLGAKNSDLSATLAKNLSGKTADATASISKGSASFTGLKPGLYLIVQDTVSDKNVKINPFMISIPDANNSYDVVASPKGGVEVPPSTEPPTTPPNRERLPQTGQLWWPVPILCIAGFMFILAGIYLKRRRIA